jgi:hypothetical protein
MCKVQFPASPSRPENVVTQLATLEVVQNRLHVALSVCIICEKENLMEMLELDHRRFTGKQNQCFKYERQFSKIHLHWSVTSPMIGETNLFKYPKNPFSPQLVFVEVPVKLHTFFSRFCEATSWFKNTFVLP